MESENMTWNHSDGQSRGEETTRGGENHCSLGVWEDIEV